jgi:hypothetical protein
MENRYFTSKMLTAIDDTIMETSASWVTGAFAKPELSMVVGFGEDILCVASWPFLDAGSLSKLLRRVREWTDQQHGSNYFEPFCVSS